MTEDKPLPSFLELLSRIVFSVVAIILFLLGLVLAGDAVVLFVRAAMVGKEMTEPALSGIGYVVVAVATFEIARHLIEEEVVRGRGRDAADARRSFTRLISTVAVAIFLEALVVVFHAGKENVPQLIYPSLLLVAATLIVVGLGVYQRLSASVEEEDSAREGRDRRSL
ncbi:MAG: GNAT family acetyltransferase [Xanthobacteraceae bacterium]